jgi:XTP/dITP diphosphohydrolase
VRLWVASQNAHKVAELARILGGSGGVEVVGIAQAGRPPQVEETAETFAGNAALKVAAVAAWLRTRAVPADGLVVADDSGICIEALDGGPGVRSARFAGPTSDDEDNNARLVDELRARGRDRSPAEYVCVLALGRVGGAALAASERDGTYAVGGVLCFEGRCRGEVRIDRRGQGGFGYDPHFWVDDGARTFAELAPQHKDARSHRGAAARQLARYLAEWLR